MVVGDEVLIRVVLLWVYFVVGVVLELFRLFNVVMICFDVFVFFGSIGKYLRFFIVGEFVRLYFLIIG